MPRADSALIVDLLAARYGAHAGLSAEEVGILRLIEGKLKRSHRADVPILRQGAEVRVPQFILSGWACRLRQLADGRRQIMGLLLPGDTIALCPRERMLARATVLTLSPVVTVEAAEIGVAWRERARVPALACALDIAAAEEEHFMLCHAMRLGRQTAYERIANLFMELEYRLASRGLAPAGRIPLPLTQETLADTVGLSVVHVNRTLQEMRRERRIELSHRSLAILDRNALITAGEFAPPRVIAHDHVRES